MTLKLSSCALTPQRSMVGLFKWSLSSWRLYLEKGMSKIQYPLWKKAPFGNRMRILLNCHSKFIWVDIFHINRLMANYDSGNGTGRRRRKETILLNWLHEINLISPYVAWPFTAAKHCDYSNSNITCNWQHTDWLSRKIHENSSYQMFLTRIS